MFITASAHIPFDALIYKYFQSPRLRFIQHVVYMIEYTSRRCYLKRQLILLLILLFGIRFSLSFGKDLSPSKFFFLKIDGEKFDKLQNFELHTQQCVKNFLMKYEIKILLRFTLPSSSEMNSNITYKYPRKENRRVG